MDRDIPQDQQQRTRRGRRWRFGAWLCLVILGLLVVRWMLKPRVALADLRLATVERGPLEATLSAAGVVKPEYEDLLTCPTDSRVVAVFARPGERLAAGDTLMQLDTRDILAERRRLHDRIALTRAQLRELLGRQRREQADLASQRAILEERIRFLEARRMQEQELYDKKLTTVWSLRQAELDESIARLELQGLGERRTHLGDADRSGAEALEIQIRLLELDQEENGEALERATLRAPRDCVLSWAVEEEGLALQKGSPLARLANLDSWKVQAELADVHTAQVQPGQSCKVRMGERSLDGTVERVHPRIENGRLRCDVRLKDPRDPDLHDNLRVDVDILRERHVNTLVLDRGPGTDANGTRPQVFVVRGRHLERRELRTGLTNRDRVEVLEGLKEGDRVVISSMNDLLHLETVALKGEER